MSESSGGGSWNLQRKDGIYAVLMLATVGGAHVLDRSEPPKPDPVLTEKVASLERNVGELRDPGGPTLRENVSRVKNHEERIHELEQALRSGVSREAVDDLKQRLADAREADKDLRQQLDNLRNAIDSLRSEIARATTSRLVGPNR